MCVRCLEICLCVVGGLLCDVVCLFVVCLCVLVSNVFVCFVCDSLGDVVWSACFLFVFVCLCACLFIVLVWLLVNDGVMVYGLLCCFVVIVFVCLCGLCVLFKMYCVMVYGVVCVFM